jgi:hypothetical protein
MQDFDPEDQFLVAIDKAVEEAARLMEIQDAMDVESEEYEMLLEARHHCGTCMVRTVMETVWPEVEKYINYLKYRTN